jgi:Glycosyltransferase like family
VPIADRKRFDAYARRGLELAREPDSLVLAPAGEDAPQRRLNAALDELAYAADLEAAVILHEDVELLSPDSTAIVRRAFDDPSVALAGTVGARSVSGIAWWEGWGVGKIFTPSVPDGEIAAPERTGAVDALDGTVLCLSPWAVRQLRFDLALSPDFHGYDVDLCFQARYHGRRVEVIDLPARHHHQPLMTGGDAWVRNALRFRTRWIDGGPFTQDERRALAGT